MVVSIVENWNDIPASTQIVTSRLLRKTMVKGSDNHHLRYTMEVQNSPINKGQRNYVRGRVNHVTTEQAQDATDIVLDTFSCQLCARNSFI
jgi:hypothetical protein